MFYGNITDMSNQHFQFDKIFTSRFDMEQALSDGSDHIFVGHFVLVKYDYQDQDYITNYNKDYPHYDDVRGYDATVWQKTYNNGTGVFIPIARLNATMPELQISPTAPVKEAGEIDFIAATPESYVIGMPSTWNFRIKKQDNVNSSDENVDYPYDIYENGQKINTLSSYSGDIYYNKKGFNIGLKNYDNSQNFISVTPGQSGKYYENNVPADDTQELSIHLPAIGNAISDFYDKIYEVNDNQQRLLDTEWYDGDDLRKINGDSVHYIGKSHDLNTVAGVINTAHDRLGQIIVSLNGIPSSQNELAELNDEYIYTCNGKYYYKTQDDVYTLIEENASNTTYTRANDITAFNYEVNTYYLDENGTSVANLPYSNYPAGTTFYKKNISAIRYTPINLIEYSPSYYYLDENNNYIRDNNDTYTKNRVYYSITEGQPKHFNASYEPGVYFVQDGTKYKCSYDSVPSDTYYNINTFSQTGLLYQPGKYYYYENNLPILAEEAYNPAISYYYIPVSNTLIPVFFNGKAYMAYELDENNKQLVSFMDSNWTNNQQVYVYDSFENAYIPFEEVNDLVTPKTYYILTLTEVNNFFFANIYYYKDNGNYLLASTFGTSSTNYYDLQTNKIITPFYKGNTYYYINENNHYVKDLNEQMSMNRQYYIETPLCVYEDSSDRYPKGYEWNSNALFVPASVQLAIKEKKDVLIELKGINNGESSINGSLLKFNKITSFNSDNTRDLKTIQGTQNKLNDIFCNFENLQPNHLVYINSFGQIVSSDYDYHDIVTIANVQQLTEDFTQYDELTQDMIEIKEDCNGKKGIISNPEYVAEILNVATSYYNVANYSTATITYNNTTTQESPFYYSQGNSSQEGYGFLSDNFDAIDQTNNPGKKYRNIDNATYINLVLRGLNFNNTYKPVWDDEESISITTPSQSDPSDYIDNSDIGIIENNEDNLGQGRFVASNYDYDWPMDLGYIKNYVDKNNDNAPSLIMTASQIAQYMEESGMAVKIDDKFTTVEPGDIIFWAHKKDIGNNEKDFVSENRYKHITHAGICYNKELLTEIPVKYTITNASNISNITIGENTYQRLLELIRYNAIMDRIPWENWDSNDYEQCFEFIYTIPGGESVSGGGDSRVWKIRRRKKINETSNIVNFSYSDMDGFNPDLLKGSYLINSAMNYEWTEYCTGALIDISTLGITATPSSNTDITCSFVLNYYNWDINKYPYKHNYFHCTSIKPFINSGTLEKRYADEVVLVCRPSLGIKSFTPLYSSVAIEDTTIASPNNISNPGTYFLSRRNNLNNGMPQYFYVEDSGHMGGYTITFDGRCTLIVSRILNKFGILQSVTQTLTHPSKNGYWQRIQYCTNGQFNSEYEAWNTGANTANGWEYFPTIDETMTLVESMIRAAIKE